MQAQRLARLMSIINDVRHNPVSNIDELCARFLISRRQFYKDRESLLALGYELHFSRKGSRLVLDRQPEAGIQVLLPDELMALILSVKEAVKADSLYQVLTASSGLEKISAALPPKFKKMFLPAIKQLVWEEALNISPAMFNEIARCIQERRRVVALPREEQPPLMLDPEGLALSRGSLCLISPSLPPDHPDVILLPGPGAAVHGLLLARVRKIVPTPFFSPRDFNLRPPA
jgi:hypothetical protein